MSQLHMMILSFRFWWMVCSLLLVLSSCTFLRSQVTPSPLAESLLKQLRLKNSAIRSFVAKGEIILEAPRMEYRGKQIMASMGPDLFLVKIFTPANAPVLYFAGRDHDFTMIDFLNKTFLRSQIKDGKFQLSDRIWIPSFYFSQAAAGKVPLVADPSVRLKTGKKHDEITLILSEHGYTDVWQVLIMEPDEPHRLKSFSLKRRNETEYSVAFSDYEEKNHIQFPKSIVIRDTSKEILLTIRHSQFMINPDLDPGQFTVQIPAHFREVKE